MKYFLFFLAACFLAGFYNEKIPVRLRPFTIPALSVFIITVFFIFEKV